MFMLQALTCLGGGAPRDPERAMERMTKQPLPFARLPTNPMHREGLLAPTGMSWQPASPIMSPIASRRTEPPNGGKLDGSSLPRNNSEIFAFEL